MLSRDRISSLAALSLLFSAAEMFIPRFLPFFRLGLSNIPMLMALDMNWASYLVLALMKGIGTSYVSGNLFSVFAAISIAQSLAAAIAMKGVSAILSSHVSVYGVSLSGALISTLVQIGGAALYAGRGTLSFLPLMLLISLPASLITAYISGRMPQEGSIPAAEADGSRPSVLVIAALVIAGAAMMMTEDLRFLVPSAAAALLFQSIAGRRIKPWPYIMLTLFMLISSLLTPHGKIIAEAAGYPITDGAITDGISKALRLCGGIALSQGCSAIIRPGKGLIGRTAATASMLLTAFRNAEGSIRQKFSAALCSETHQISRKQPSNITIFTLIGTSVIITALAIADCLFF